MEITVIHQNMKRLYYLIVIGIGLIALLSCEKMTSEMLPFSLTSTNGETKSYKDSDTGLVFDQAYFMDPSDIDRCVWASAHTNGRMVNELIWLSMYIKDGSLKAGKEPRFERLSFGLPASSNSNDYTGKYNGRITVKEFSKEQLVLRFHNVVFNIAAGTYTLNGDIAFSSDLPDYLKE